MTPTIELHFWPWVMRAQSKSDPTKYHLVNLSANNLKGGCDCRWSRITRTDCSHLKAARDLWWREVAPGIRRIEQ